MDSPRNSLASCPSLSSVARNISGLRLIDLTVPLMVLGIASAFLLESYRAPSMTLFGWGPMLFPRWLCGGALLIVLANFMKTLSAAGKRNRSRSRISRSQICFLLLLSTALLLLPRMGYRPVLTGFLFTAAIAAGGRGWRLSVAALWSLLLPLSSWWLFSDVLKVFLP